MDSMKSVKDKCINLNDYSIHGYNINLYFKVIFILHCYITNK